MTVYANGASALRHGYLVKHRAFNLALRTYDAGLRLARSRATPQSIEDPRRLLLCIGGHLGDAVIATSVLSPLRAAYPDMSIGILAPSWSHSVFAGHPAVDQLHAVDHWKAARRGTRAERWSTYKQTRNTARSALTGARYDAAIDLYPYFPNSARILADAKITTRVGYTSGGGGALFTHAVPWHDTRLHTAAQHRELLRAVLPRLAAEPLHYDLPPIPEAGLENARSLVESLGVRRDRYVVVHPGAGDARKQWPVDRWRSLLTQLVAAADVDIVLTGTEADAPLAQSILSANDRRIASLAGRTSWDELRAVIAEASLFLGVDSVAAHLAAAYDVPSVSVMAGMSDPAHWRPLGTRAVVLTNNVSCAPCFQSRGCAAMSCVRGVSVAAVLDAALSSMSETAA